MATKNDVKPKRIYKKSPDVLSCIPGPYALPVMAITAATAIGAITLGSFDSKNMNNYLIGGGLFGAATIGIYSLLVGDKPHR